MDKKDYIKSLKITGVTLFIISTFWFLFSIQTSFGYSGTGTIHDLKSGSILNGDLLAQPLSGSVTIYFGTQSTSPVGTGTVGYIGTSTAGLPKIKYSYTGGSSTITFDGFTHVAINNSDIPLSGSLSTKLDATGGVGTNNTFNSPTLAGLGTITATFNANGLDISPAELSMIDGATISLNKATGSITSHTHTGSDGTTQIPHNNITGTGTNSHSTIDTFIASKAQASGLASLDASSLVIQNPANATNSPTASKIPISLGTGKLDDAWISSTFAPGTPTFSAITGVPTDNSNFAIVSGTSTGLIRDARGNANLNGIDFIGTTTLYAGGTRTTPLLYSRKTTKPNDMTSNVLLYVPADAGGSSTTFTDYSQYAATFTVAGNAVSSSAWSEFGGASFYASNGSATIAAATDGRYNIFGTDTCYISMFVKMDNVTTNMPFFTLGSFGQTGLYFSGAGGNGLVFSVYSTGAGSIIQGNTTGWSAGVKYHVAVRKYGNGGYHLLREGVVVASGTITDNWHLNKNFILGYNDLPQTIAGFIDDFYWEKNTTGTDVVPTTAKNLSSYIETTTYYIPVGTTTTFLSIVDSGTYSSNTKVVIGAAPYSTITTGYGLDAASKAILAKSYVTTPSSSAVKTDLPSKTSPQAEAVDIMRKSKAHKYFYKNKVVAAEIAENKAKEDYLNQQRPSEFELFRTLHENEYLEGVTGSMSVNYKRMKDAFETGYPAKMNIKWNALNDKNSRIVEAKAHLEKDPNDARNNTDNYGIEIDRDCPKEVLNKDGLPVLEKWAGFNYSVNKGLVDLVDRQQIEIGSLTAALENMRVINNLK